MSNRSIRQDFISFGLFISLSWHIVLFLFVVPVFNGAVSFRPDSSTFFLGRLLKDPDLEPLTLPKRTTRNVSFMTEKGISGAAYFKKSSQDVYKPKIGLAYPEVQLKTKDISSDRPVSMQASGNVVSFGFSDYLHYVDNVDFSDLKRMASREDLFQFIEFEVFLSKSGEVRRIRKVLGCGDPILDFYVMLKLRNAVFKTAAKEGQPAVVRFRIR